MSLSGSDLATLLCSPSQLRAFTDAELMAALRVGCNDALAILFERHSALVFRIARAIVRDDGEAEETVQRVFLDVFRAAKQFDPDRGSFNTWLLQYTYHRSLDRREHLQANRFYTCKSLDEFTASEMGNGTGHLLCLLPAEIARLAEEGLALLEPRQRRVLELTYFEGLTAEEVATRTGDSAASVRHSLYRGLTKLRDALHAAARATTNTASERQPRMKGVLVGYPRTL
jgi:RNA polymerase sigma-70 factor (ECF subfamily)